MNCKNNLRREMIEKRKELCLKNKDLFTENIKSLDSYKRAQCVMLYMPISGEADVTGLLSDEKIFLTPVIKGDDIYPVLLGSLEKGSFNVPEPVDKTEYNGKIDIVLIPGVAFDKNFNRMGFGKGFYDRFLENTNAVKVGICHSFQLLEEIPSEKHDVKMDIIVTEKDIWKRENIL